MIKCDYDIAIIGGGVAGLAAANLLATKGFKTIVVEKHKYPFHKVCGEYISLESKEFLELIDFDYQHYNLPIINKFKLTAGKSSLNTKLPLGGIGVSRYLLDEQLMKSAGKKGAEILDSTTVSKINYNNYFKVKTTTGEFSANIVIGAYGKKSNIDDLKPVKTNKANNFIAVKYHVTADCPHDQIELHIFKNGYCGISKVEGEGKYCLCYMTSAQNLINSNNSIEILEQTILSRNKHLRKYFAHYDKLFENPVTISQIKLGIKEPLFNNMIMIGDAAGTIAPLCGNGMSIGFHSAYIAAQILEDYFQKQMNYSEVLYRYELQWKQNFSERIKTGIYFQKLFMNEKAAEFAINILKYIPTIHSPLIKLTHGKNFVSNHFKGIPVR